jgi:hypothetical protein
MSLTKLGEGYMYQNELFNVQRSVQSIVTTIFTCSSAEDMGGLDAALS